jgi:hypothetical protein
MAPLVLAALFLLLAAHASAGVTSSYRRSLLTLPDMPLDADVFRAPPGYNAPEQVHITQGDLTGRAMTVSWVTRERPGSNVVRYGFAADCLNLTAKGTVRRYTWGGVYRSPYIHHATLNGLNHGTVYHYAVGHGYTVRTFSFKTPPKPGPDVPIKFGIIGIRCIACHLINQVNPKSLPIYGILGDLEMPFTYVLQVTWDRRSTPTTR